MKKVFIDGQSGTTGLKIHQHLTDRSDICLLQIDKAERKNAAAKEALLADADVTVLCLPDDAARETAALAANHNTRLLDASTAHRTDPAWVYGLPELDKAQRGHITEARYVSNPGCWPTGFLLLVRPLVNAGLLAPDSLLTVNGVSGYSGGGRQMIEDYQTREAEQADKLWSSRPYGFALNHKHLPEMQQLAGLTNKPIFTPNVGHFYQGMLVHVPLFQQQLSSIQKPEAVAELWRSAYQHEACIRVHAANSDAELEAGFLDPQGNNLTNRVDLFVFGHEEQLLLTARLDNLGKGASGAAVQNLNLMLGFDELAGLKV